MRALEAPADRAEWAEQLADLGFIAGESVTLVRRGPIGGDPLVVRVGDSSCYALRRDEARCVHIEHTELDDAAPSAPEAPARPASKAAP